jgi:protein SCO1/2
MPKPCTRGGFLRLSLAATCALLAAPLRAHNAEHGNHAVPEIKPVAPQGAKVTVTDTPLVDQDGRRLRFKSEVLADRIVIIGFVYTSCTTVCPVTSQIMAQAQTRLGERAARDVAFVTVTVDPVRDRPAVLKAHAERIGANWRWLTGAKPQVDEVLRGFGAWTANFVDHPPLIMVGDAKSGRWLRFFGFPDPDQLVAAVGELGAARNRHGSHGSHG